MMRPTSRAILILVGLPVMACLLGFLVGATIEAAPVPWVSLGAPPQPAVRLLGARQSGPNTFSIIAEVASGDVFEHSQIPSDDWTMASPQSSYHSRPCGAIEPPFAVPSAPLEVIACTEYDPGFEATSFEVRRYILGPDGSVWTWQKEKRIISDGVFYGGVGLLAGLASAIVLALRYGMPTQPNPFKPA